jgi:hypothetical protein
MKSVVFLLGLVMAFPASAQTLTGNELLARCKGQLNHERAWCLGYVHGFQSGLFMADALGFRGPNGNGVYCVPMNVTVTQATDVIVKSLEENPATRHDGAALLAFNALVRAFPCPRRQ